VMGEGWDGRRLRGPLARRGVDILDLSPPTFTLLDRILYRTSLENITYLTG
jgi:hypothetical protein